MLPEEADKKSADGDKNVFPNLKPATEDTVDVEALLVRVPTDSRRAVRQSQQEAQTKNTLLFECTTNSLRAA